LTWEPPAYNGGSALIDYRLWWDNASDGNTFTVYTESLSDTNYIVSPTEQGKEY
jgi:hypothetical protein